MPILSERTKTCESCRNVYRVRFNASKDQIKKSRFCSNRCRGYGVKPNKETRRKMSKSHTKDKHWNWRGGRRKALGYVMVKGSPKKYKQEHRLIMEKHLKRKLRTDEIVHHKNGNKSDNRIENLEVMTKSEHHKHHAKEYWKSRRES